MSTVKKGLGRGLGALLSAYEEESSHGADEKLIRNDISNSGGVTEIEIKEIKANPNQPRKNFDQEALKELAASIKTHGVIQPILLNKNSDGYIIIAGERRFRAAKLAGLDTIPAVVKNYTERQIKEVAIIENLQREDLNPIEEAKAIKQLMEEYHLTQETVADRIGKSRSNIANSLRLLTLYPEVVDMVEEGKLSAGHARCLVVVSNVNDQLKLAKAAENGKMSVRDLERAVKELLTPKAPTRPKEQQSIELKELINNMQRVFSTKVSAIGNDNKGRIYLDYYSRDDLDRIAEILELVQSKSLTLKDLQNFNKK